MRNIIRWLAVAAIFALPLGIALVQAQDPTAVPTGDATVEATVEATSDATMEVTSEVTMEATTEVTAEATSAPASGVTTTATLESTVTPAAATSSQTGTGLVTCDSDLILNLYTAERYFGFAGVINAAMTGDTTNTSAFVDLTTIDKGQYTPLFTNMMGMMDNAMMMPGSMMTLEQMQTMGSMMNMDQTAMMNQMATMMPPGTDMSSMTTLAAASIAGEAQECTMLRAELNRFFSLLAFTDMQAGMGMTAEATRSVNNVVTAGSSMNFSATLSGANEVPPADLDGTGTAAVTVDMANTQICYTLLVQNIALPAAAAHIHRGAAGENGDVVVPFNIAPDASGTATSCVKVDAALLTEIAQNPAGFYVNVHTSEFPDGAVRGQVSG